MINQALWDRLVAADLQLAPDLHAAFGWSERHITRAITEYRRFLYLHALSAGPKSAPGVVIDAVWRVHRAQGTRYEWYCKLHVGHVLLSSGASAAPDHAAWHRLYRQEFGTAPPPQLWPAPEARRGKAPAVALVLAGLGASALSASIWPLLLCLGAAVFALRRKPPRGQPGTPHARREDLFDDGWHIGLLLGYGAATSASTGSPPEGDPDEVCLYQEYPDDFQDGFPDGFPDDVHDNFPDGHGGHDGN